MSKFRIDALAGWLRRPQTWGFIVAIVICAIVSVTFFGSDALQGRVLQQPDIRQGVAIGQEVKAWEAETGEVSRWTNSLFGGMPNFQINPSYPSGKLFSWLNDVYGLGLPAPANLLMMMMLGFLILMAAMRVRWGVALLGAVAYGLSSYFVIIIGAGHIWKFVTLAYIPPTIAGLVLCYRGRYLAGGALAALFAMLQVASNHVQMTYYFLFVMVAMAIAYLWHAYRSGTVRQWAIGTGVLAAAGVLAVAANMPSLYNTYEYSKETMRGRHSELTQPDGSNAAGATGLDKDYITQYSYGRSELMTLLIPNVKGGASAKPVAGSMVGLTLADLPEAQELYARGEITSQDAQNLQAFSQYFGEPEGTNGPVYIGAIVFALFLLGAIIVRGPMKWALVVMTLLSCGLALGRNLMWLTDLFIDWIPMYSSFRTVESILVIAEFTMPLLAALGLQKILSDDRPLSTYRKPLLWAFGIPLALCLLGIIVPEVFGSYIGGREQEYLDNGLDQRYPVLFAAVEKLRHSMISADAMRSFLFLGAAFGVFMLMISGKLRRSWGTGIIVTLVIADLFTVDRRYLNHESFCDDRRSMEPVIVPTDADREILEADTGMNYRVMDIERFMSPDPSYFHKAVGGYHAAKLTRYQDLIDRHLSHFLQVGYNPELRDDSMALVLTGSPQVAAKLKADLRVLDMLNARYIVTESGIPERNDYALGNAWFVKKLDYVAGPDDEMEALQTLLPGEAAVADVRFRPVLGDDQPQYTPGDTIYETSYAPNRLTYHAKTANGGLAVLSEIYFPWGWEATVDGEPVGIGRVNYVLRALRVPAGEHDIELRFDPRSLRVTDTMATVAVLLIFAAVIAALIVWWRRDTSTPTAV